MESCEWERGRCRNVIDGSEEAAIRRQTTSRPGSSEHFRNIFLLHSMEFAEGVLDALRVPAMVHGEFITCNVSDGR
jgi:hypothetical protein